MMKTWQGNTDDVKVANKILKRLKLGKEIGMMENWQGNRDDEKLARK